MVLKSFEFASFLGWVLGIFFVKKPWGLPQHTSLCHPYIIYSVVLNVCNAFLWYDFYCKTTSDLLEKNSLVDKILFIALIIAFNLFDVFFRFVLVFYRKEIPGLLVELEKVRFGELGRDYEKCRKFHCLFRFFLLLPRLMCPVLMLFWYFTNIQPKSGIGIIPNSIWYYVSFFILAEIPIMFSIIFIYDLILVTIFCMLRTFEDYAGSVYNVIIGRSHFVESSPNFAIGQKDSISPTPSFVVISEVESCNIQPLIKDALNKFENLDSLGKKFDQVIGPLIFGIILRSVFMIVHSANSLLLARPISESRSQNFIKDTFDVFILIIEISQLMVLELGSEVVGRIAAWKMRLTNAIIFMEDDGDKKQMKELVQVICKWEWKISAMGLFDVQRSLICGIVTTILNYVILLFQFKLSDKSMQAATTTTPVTISPY